MTTTQKPATGKKGNTFVRAMVDLFILMLLLAGAGGFGYWFGTQQRMAPVELVGAGTPGARTADGAKPATTAPTTTAPTVTTSGSNSSEQEESATKSAEPSNAPAKSTKAAAKGHAKLKYWLMSSGADYVGYSITVSVNGQSVDNFFGPGKTVDVTRMIKKGNNDITFDAKALEEKYNQHKGDQNFKLKVVLVGSPSITENYKPEDALLTYVRTAADSQDFDDTMHFVAE